MEAPIVHPELGVGVEWRFEYFRAYNAELIVNAASRILWEQAYQGKPKHPEIQKYINGLQPRLAELLPDGRPAGAT